MGHEQDTTMIIVAALRLILRLMEYLTKCLRFSIFAMLFLSSTRVGTLGGVHGLWLHRGGTQLNYLHRKVVWPKYFLRICHRLQCIRYFSFRRIESKYLCHGLLSRARDDIRFDFQLCSINKIVQTKENKYNPYVSVRTLITWPTVVALAIVVSNTNTPVRYCYRNLQRILLFSAKSNQFLATRE